MQREEIGGEGRKDAKGGDSRRRKLGRMQREENRTEEDKGREREIICER